jgi:GR25 family glycosyltransferase involved in LPS biosynthesis
MSYAGRFINMDRSVERRSVLEAQFAALGCSDRYARFPAVDGQSLDRTRSSLTAGECGCFESHYRCVKESMGDDSYKPVVDQRTLYLKFTVDDEGKFLLTSFKEA